MLFARGAAAFAAAAAAADRRCATISVGDQLFSLLVSCCFSFVRACVRYKQRCQACRNGAACLDQAPSLFQQRCQLHETGYEGVIRPHLHSGDCILGALQDVALSSLRQLRGGCHGVAVLHRLRSCARDLLGDVRALVRGGHQLQLVPQPQCALLQEAQNLSAEKTRTSVSICMKLIGLCFMLQCCTGTAVQSWYCKYAARHVVL